MSVPCRNSDDIASSTPYEEDDADECTDLLCDNLDGECTALEHLELHLGGFCAKSEELRQLISRLANGSTDLFDAPHEKWKRESGLIKQLKVGSFSACSGAMLSALDNLT